MGRNFLIIASFITICVFFNACLGERQVSGHKEISAAAIKHTDYAGENKVFQIAAYLNDGSDGLIPSLGARLTGNENELGRMLNFEAEGGAGIIVRGQLIDTQLAMSGPLKHVNFKFTADTGLILRDGIEAKWFGAGLYAGKSGFEICLVFCIGYKV